MNTKKEQVKAKIVEVCPDLMELSFGCWIKNKNTNDSLFVLCEMFGGVLHWNFEINEARILRPQEFEILGHPIQLHHVLRALNQKSDYDYVVATDGHFLKMCGSNELGILSFEGTGVYWKTPQDFDDQDESVFEFLHTIIC